MAQRRTRPNSRRNNRGPRSGRRPQGGSGGGRRPQGSGRSSSHARRRPAYFKPIIAKAPDAGTLFLDPLDPINLEAYPALVSQFPELPENLPWISLRSCVEPSVPARMYHSQHLFGDNCAYMKRESLDAYVLPDNKAKKLEFILGEAVLQNKKKFVTFGYTGSSHCMAVAKAAQGLGRKAEINLLRAPLSYESMEMIAALKGMGAKVRFYSSWKTIGLRGLWTWLLAKIFPIEVIPPGGSCPLGVLGYVSSMFELRDQISRGECPKPDMIFVAMGSGATYLGMLIGKQLAGLDGVELFGIQTSDDRGVEPDRLLEMGNGAIEILNEYLDQPVNFRLSASSLKILKDYVYEGHGRLPEKVERWKNRIQELELIQLDDTYTAKALYGMADYLEKNRISGKTALFWNTYSPFRKSDIAKNFRLRDLPYRVRRWAKEDKRAGRILGVEPI